MSRYFGVLKQRGRSITAQMKRLCRTSCKCPISSWVSRFWKFVSDSPSPSSGAIKRKAAYNGKLLCPVFRGSEQRWLNGLRMVGDANFQWLVKQLLFICRPLALQFLALEMEQTMIRPIVVCTLSSSKLIHLDQCQSV